MRDKKVCKECGKPIGLKDPYWTVATLGRIPTKRGIRKITKGYRIYCIDCGLNKKADS